MGSLCSKPHTFSGGDTVLRPIGSSSRGQPLGNQSSERPDPRTAAAQAAEQRLKAAQARGTSASNPQQGRLAARLEASKSAPRVPEPRQQERLVWD